MAERPHRLGYLYFTGTLLFVQFRFPYFTGYPSPSIHNGFHKVSHAASNVGWRSIPPAHTKDYGIKPLALFIPFPFALIESLWLLLKSKNVV